MSIQFPSSVNFINSSKKLLFNRLKVNINDKLIKDQGDFRPGRYTSGQVLNLTQHIENGLKK